MGALVAFLVVAASASVSLDELDAVWTQRDREVYGLRETWEFRSNSAHYGSGTFRREVNQGEGRVFLKTGAKDLEFRANRLSAATFDRKTGFFSAGPRANEGQIASEVWSGLGMVLGTQGLLIVPQLGIAEIEVASNGSGETTYIGRGSYYGAASELKIRVDANDGTLMGSTITFGKEPHRITLTFERISRSVAAGPEPVESSFSMKDLAARRPASEGVVLPSYLVSESPRKLPVGTRITPVLMHVFSKALQGGPSRERWMISTKDGSGKPVPALEGVFATEIRRDWPRFYLETSFLRMMSDGGIGVLEVSVTTPNSDYNAMSLTTSIPPFTRAQADDDGKEDQLQVIYTSAIMAFYGGCPIRLVRAEQASTGTKDVRLVFAGKKGPKSYDLQLSFTGDTWDLNEMTGNLVGSDKSFQVEWKRVSVERGVKFSDAEFRPTAEKLKKFDLPVWFETSK